MKENENIKKEIKIINKEIIKKEQEKKELINKYYSNKFNEFINNSMNNIFNIIFIYKENNWKIKYNHITNNYSTKNYIYKKSCIDDSDSDSDSDNENLDSYSKQTKISFGYKKNKYYIKNYMNTLQDIKIYTSCKLPRLYSDSYEFTNIDMDNLLNQYSKNYDIPEWLMITILNKIYESNLHSKFIIDYFSIKI